MEPDRYEAVEARAAWAQAIREHAARGRRGRRAGRRARLGAEDLTPAQTQRAERPGMIRKEPPEMVDGEDLTSHLDWLRSLREDPTDA
jgi:hypothetical protein